MKRAVVPCGVIIGGTHKRVPTYPHGSRRKGPPVPDVQYPDDSISNPSNIRIEDLLGADDEAASPSPDVPVREGLPRTFRMRADKHYVEMLDGPPQQPAKESAPAATTSARQTESATAVPDPGAVVATQAGRELAQSLSALRASTNLLSDRGPALVSTVAANLIRAEAWRATCLLQSSRFLRGEIPLVPKQVQGQAILDQVLKSIEPERRLRGITIDERISVGDARVLVDEDVLVGALSGLLMATMALAEEQSAFAVTLVAERRASEIMFAITQDLVRPSSNWATDAVQVAAAERIVTACGGRFGAAVTASGTDVRFALQALR